MVWDRQGGRRILSEENEVTSFLPVKDKAKLGQGADEFAAGDDRQLFHTQTTWTSKRSSGIGWSCA